MKLSYITIGICATVLAVIAFAETSHTAHAAGTVSPGTPSCLTTGLGNPSFTSNSTAECFLTWSDGTRCVSLVGPPASTGGAPVVAMQCAFSGVVGVP